MQPWRTLLRRTGCVISPRSPNIVTELVCAAFRGPYDSDMTPLEELRSMIDTHGWAVRNVASANAAECLSYTVGLTRHQHPEVVMTGLPSEVGTAFLNIVGEIVVREGGAFVPGQSTDELADGTPMPILNVTDTSALTAVEELFGSVAAIQIVWTDSTGNLPWDHAYANPGGSQPLLGPP
jgi:hypothetical protein